MQFLKAFLGPSGWGVTVYKLYAVCTCMEFLIDMCVSTIQNCCYKTKDSNFFFFHVLLTVHLSIFISVINQLDAQNFCFTISLLHSLWYHHTYWCDDTRGCVMQF